MKRKSMKVFLITALLVIGVLAAMPALAAPDEIEIIDLGTLYPSDTSSNANDVNESGQVVGWSRAPSQLSGFFWTARDGMISVGSLGGNRTVAIGINNRGQVVGTSQNSAGYQRAFLWTMADGMRDLGTLGGDTSQARQINDRGQVVGDSSNSLGQDWAFVWTESDGMMNLGTLGGEESTASGINGRGHIVGYSETAGGETRAFLWTAQDGMVDLGSLGGGSAAYDVNDHGQVVGESCLSGDFDPIRLECSDGSLAHAVFWSAARGMVDLGTLGGDWSWASCINNRGQVTGTSATASGERRAFLWTVAQGMVDLGTLDGGSESHALCANEFGHIVGSSGDPGTNHAVLWLPGR